MKKAMRFLMVALVIVILGISVSWAYYQLARGIVRRQSTGVPISGAYVQGCNNIDTKVTDTSGSHGEYSLERDTPDFPAGTYYLCASKSGEGSGSAQGDYPSTIVTDIFLSGSGSCPQCSMGK